MTYAAATPSTNIRSVLGADADALLGHESRTVSKSELHLPGPDFVDRVVSQTDRSPQVMRSFQSLLNHGRLAGTGYAVVVEPGRSIVGNAGVLLTRVEYLKLDKDRRFAIVDASMSELIRPALYEAWHEIAPLAALDRPEAVYDVVGPVCESSDVLGTDRRLAIEAGDGLAILSAGAYGMAMASNYNSRPRPAEVMVDGARAAEVRARETIASLFAGESTLG